MFRRVRPFPVLSVAGAVALATLSISTFAQDAAFRDRAVTVRLSTGSDVGEWIIPGEGERVRRTIVVFLHGGPGLYTEQRRIEEGAVFRHAGFTTAYYDRAGGGVSGRLPAAQYSFEREIRDLEAYRVHLNADSLILWGNSYGAALATAYAAQYPQHVSALVLTSPGTFPGRTVERDFSRTERVPVVLSRQMREAVALIDAEGAAAENRLGQAEAGAMFDTLVSSQLADGFLCKGAEASLPTLPGGGNLYAQRLITSSAAEARLAASPRGRFPALVIRGSCDFMPASNAAQYVTFLGGDLVTIEGGGHGLLEDHRVVDNAIAAFLNDQVTGVP